jgi:hypothetical protein
MSIRIVEATLLHIAIGLYGNTVDSVLDDQDFVMSFSALHRESSSKRCFSAFTATDGQKRYST